jgi:hypothetical protein
MKRVIVFSPLSGSLDSDRRWVVPERKTRAAPISSGDCRKNVYRPARSDLKKGAATDLNSAADALLAQAAEVGGAKVIAGEAPAAAVVRQPCSRVKCIPRAAECLCPVPTDRALTRIVPCR